MLEEAADALAAPQPESAQQDAARYRWLRDVAGAEEIDEAIYLLSSEWDDYIDRAMQGEQK